MAKKKTPKAVNKEAVGKEIKTVLLFGAGVVLGSMGGKMLDKVLKVDTTDTSFNVKKMVRPLVLIGAGTIGSLKLPNEHLKQLAKGVAVSGMLTGVKVFLKKDLLNGLAGFEGLGDGLQATKLYYEPGYGQEIPLSDAEVIDSGYGQPLRLGAASIESYRPDLPALEAYPEDGYGASVGEINSIDAIGDVIDVEII